MTVRKTLDQMTSDDLDTLYDALDQAREGERILGARVNDWVALAKSHQHWGQRRWNAWKSARARAARAAASMARVRQIHHPVGVVAAAEAGVEPDCAVCGPNRWPCPTYEAVTEPEPTPAPAATQATDSP